MDRTLNASIAVAMYCTRERAHLPGTDPARSEADLRSREILICLVEQAGGPEEFLRQNIAAAGMLGKFEEANESRGPCRPSR